MTGPTFPAMRRGWQPCDDGCPGWFVDAESGEIQACDECRRFVDLDGDPCDVAAMAHVIALARRVEPDASAAGTIARLAPSVPLAPVLDEAPQPVSVDAVPACLLAFEVSPHAYVARRWPESDAELDALALAETAGLVSLHEDADEDTFAELMPAGYNALERRHDAAAPSSVDALTTIERALPFDYVVEVWQGDGDGKSHATVRGPGDVFGGMRRERDGARVDLWGEGPTMADAIVALAASIAAAEEQ